MMRIVLWLAVACAVILAALALSRGVRFTSEPAKPAETAPAAEEAAAPVAAQTPEPAPVEAAPQPTPEDLQVQEDAAAVGLTTVEPQTADPPVIQPPAPEPQF